MAMLVAILIGLSSLAQDTYGFQLSRHSVPLDHIVSGGPPKDGIPALTQPVFIPAAGADHISDDDRVVGVREGSVAKAYPLQILNWHEVVNDRLGERPVAVTFCPLTASAVVFERDLGDREVTFGVSGLLYQSNVLLYDRQTESLWSQLRQEAVAGPETGTSLTPFPAVETTWGWWRAKHPDTLVLSPETGHSREYALNPYAGYEESPGVMFPTSNNDQRLGAKELVLGVVVDGIPRAYPVRRLARLRRPLHDSFGTSELVIQYDPLTATAEAFVGGHPLAATVVYWFAWAAFHPETGLWEGAHADEAVALRLGDVSISEQKGYWSNLVGVLTDDPVRHPNGPASLYVISGSLKNTSAHPVHHVELRFELLDSGGAVVHHQAGFNRSAEALLPSATGNSETPEVEPIMPGATDSFRMLLFGDELPEFTETRVTVVRVR